MTGSGTLLDPFIIYDVADLQAMANDLDAYYELANDIDASATSTWNWNATRGVYEGFMPVGEAVTGSEFRGVLDGKGFEITDLYINSSGIKAVGLFGYAYHLGVITIKDVHLVDVNITATDEDAGVMYAGALVGGIGQATGIRRSSSTGTIDVHNTSTSGSASLHAGGLIGNASITTIYECYSQVAVTATCDGNRAVAGGLIGQIVQSALENSYARGDVNSIGGIGVLSGGLLGMNRGDVDKTYSTGSVTGSKTGGMPGEDIHIGGLIGDDNDGEGVTADSFWDTETSGQATSDGGTGKTTVQMKTKSTFTDADWDFDTIWDILSIINDGYPYLRGVTRPIAPTVTTNAATSVTKNTATLNGTLDGDGGETCDVRFQYGRTTDYNVNTIWQSGKETLDTFEQAISLLNQKKTYHCRAQAKNSVGTANGGDVDFTTLGVAYTGNIIIDQLIYQHAERMER